jgi:hypothetical protein
MEYLGWSRSPRDEDINASIDEHAQTHSHLIGALHDAFKRRTKSNEALKKSIRIANTRTTSFADFERMAIRREEMK